MLKDLEQKECKIKEEIWRDIAGYKGRYQVSNMGRVKSLAHVTIRKNGSKLPVKERILQPVSTLEGYLQATLYNGCSKKKFLVHRLVCKAFHGTPKNKPCVNHIDENKANNTASNLEWCTYEENLNHGTRSSRAGKTIAKAKSKAAGQYTFEGELIKIWQSLMEIERQLGFDHGSISKVARGKRKTAHGYVWKYIEEGK